MLSKFCRWWLDGLLAPLPGAVADWLDPPRPRLLLELTGEHLSALEHTASQWSEVRRAALDDAPALAQLSSMCRTHKQRGGIVALRVPAAQALVREVDVGAVPPAELHQFFAARIDEYTPFSSNQVHYSCLRLTEPEAGDRFRVRLLVAPKRYLEPAMQQLRAAGLEADTAEVEGHELSGGELIPVTNGGRGGRWAAAAAMLAIVLAAFAAYLPVTSRNRALETLRAEEQVLTRQIAAIAEDLNDSDATRLTTVARLRNERPLAVTLVNALSEQIPDHTWLRQLIIADSEVTLQGETRQTADLIARLESSTWFEDAKFDAALTRDTESNTERFKLTARIAQP